MRHAFATAAVLLALLGLPPGAAAQPGFAPMVSASDAQQIAGQNGLVVIYWLRLDEGVWKIEGRDGNGRYVYMRIDPRNGR